MTYRQCDIQTDSVTYRQCDIQTAAYNPLTEVSNLSDLVVTQVNGVQVLEVIKVLNTLDQVLM